MRHVDPTVRCFVLLNKCLPFYLDPRDCYMLLNIDNIQQFGDLDEI